MVNSQLYKLVIWLVGTVILGAIGSGLWDTVFKPVFPKLGVFVLTISTLGLRAVQDSMYIEIARGNYERAGLDTFQLITGVMGGITIGFVFGFYIRRRYLATIDVQKPNQLSFIGSPLMIPTMLIVCLFAGSLPVSAVRATYIVRAACELQQMQDIVAPLLSDDERINLRSKVAQIRSREDYQNIVDQMSKMAEKNGLSVPSFNIF